MDRADQTTKVRGLFVHPSQVADIVRRHPEVERARLEISGSTGSDRIVLKIESSIPSQTLSEQLALTTRELTKLRTEIE